MTEGSLFVAATVPLEAPSFHEATLHTHSMAMCLHSVRWALHCLCAAQVGTFRLEASWEPTMVTVHRKMAGPWFQRRRPHPGTGAQLWGATMDDAGSACIHARMDDAGRVCIHVMATGQDRKSVVSP